MASKIKVRAVKLLNTTLGDVLKDREEDEAAPAIDLPTDVATIVIPRTETPGDYEDGVYLMPTTAPEAQVLDICKRALRMPCLVRRRKLRSITVLRLRRAFRCLATIQVKPGRWSLVRGVIPVEIPVSTSSASTRVHAELPRTTSGMPYGFPTKRAKSR